MDTKAVSQKPSPTREDIQLYDDLNPQLQVLAGLLGLISTSRLAETREGLVLIALDHLATVARDAQARLRAWSEGHTPPAEEGGAV